MLALNFFSCLVGRPVGRPAGRRAGRPAGRRVGRLAGRRAWRILGRPGTSRGKKLPAALHGSRDVARGVSWDVPRRPMEKKCLRRSNVKPM